MSRSIEFLEAEALAEERRVKVTALVGVFVAVLLTVYMIWIANAVEESVQPDLVADLATGTAINVLPQVGENLRDGLIEAAPEVAATLTGALIDAVPVMRQRLQQSIVEMTDEMATASAEDVGTRLGQLVVAGTAESASAAVETAMSRLVEQLDKEIYGPPSSKRSDRTGAKAGIFTSMRESADQLRLINGRLRALAANDRPNADEAAMKRLITTWLGVVSPADEN